MLVFRGHAHTRLRRPCALTIGSFDGVHRGHQAMLALLVSEARHRGLPSCVLTFEPHPREYFARLARSKGASIQAPVRIATLRDKLRELEACGIDQVVVQRFDARLAALSPRVFVHDVVASGLGARYVLVGDDFRFGAQRAGDYAMLDAEGDAMGIDIARMQSYEVHGQRVSSSAVRDALSKGDMVVARTLLGHPHTLSGRVQHGRKLGRELGFPTLNIRFAGERSAARGIFVTSVEGLSDTPLPGVASLGVRPAVEQNGRLLLEVHCLDWPQTLGADGAYGRCVAVTLLHKLHDEHAYPSLDALKTGIAADVQQAQAWWDANSHAYLRPGSESRP
jgi:riboflavin kinase / FMN adenylyltransferase